MEDVKKEIDYSLKTQIRRFPPRLYLTIKGRGDPNGNESFQRAITVLYSLSYNIKMKEKGRNDYYPFVVAPLEGLWAIEGGVFDYHQRDNWRWTLMIAQPRFVDRSLITKYQTLLSQKDPLLPYHEAALATIDQGLCIQALHVGPFASEEATITKMHAILADRYVVDLRQRHHQEIYLSDFRRTSPDKLKTLIRLPIIEK